MAKIYYTDAEAAAKLNIPVADLANMVRDGKLRAFPDGPRKMYKVDEVDKLADSAAPADAGISLDEADKPRPAGKEDTVITAEGISIFDDEDLDIEAADPMAKTQIAPTLDEQVSIEGVGSGSGLLDLTRESDDTSLGEVLETIDQSTASAVGSSLGGDEITHASNAGAAEGPIVMPTLVEIPDASSGAFNGMAVGLAIVMLAASAVSLSMLMHNGTDLAGSLHENIYAVLGVGLAVALVGTLIGFFMGKSTAQKHGARPAA